MYAYDHALMTYRRRHPMPMCPGRRNASSRSAKNAALRSVGRWDEEGCALALSGLLQSNRAAPPTAIDPLLFLETGRKWIALLEARLVK